MRIDLVNRHQETSPYHLIEPGKFFVVLDDGTKGHMHLRLTSHDSVNLVTNEAVEYKPDVVCEVFDDGTLTVYRGACGQ